MIETTIGVGGMMCDMCEAHINDQIRRSFDVVSAKSNRRKNQCVVVSEQELDPKAVEEAIRAVGYDYLSISSKPYEKRRGFFGFGRG